MSESFQWFIHFASGPRRWVSLYLHLSFSAPKWAPHKLTSKTWFAPTVHGDLMACVSELCSQCSASAGQWRRRSTPDKLELQIWGFATYSTDPDNRLHFTDGVCKWLEIWMHLRLERIYFLFCFSLSIVSFCFWKTWLCDFWCNVCKAGNLLGSGNTRRGGRRVKKTIKNLDSRLSVLAVRGAQQHICS